jgi:hypothetical protein
MCLFFRKWYGVCSCRRTDLEKMISSRCRLHACNLFRECQDNLVNVGNRVIANLPFGREIQIHTKVVMTGTPNVIELFSAVSYCLESQSMKWVTTAGSSCTMNKSSLCQHPVNCFPLIIFVGKTRIVRIYVKAERNEVSNKFSIK